MGGTGIFHEESETSQMEARLEEKTTLTLAIGRNLEALETKDPLKVNLCLPCGAGENWNPWIFIMGE